MPEPKPITIAALYRFVDLEDDQVDYRVIREPLLETLRSNGIRGTLLLAAEGINGTIAGEPDTMKQFLADLQSDPQFHGKFADLEIKYSYADKQPFRRAKVRLKKEIVTIGKTAKDIDPINDVGEYVEPEDWNALIDDPDVTLIDTRNDYEVAIGTFKKSTGETAIDPATDSFNEFPEYVDQHLDPSKHKKVAMFCTGGIRCEKATAYLRKQGFENVYHLHGGILNYLEKVPADQTRWDGECYVFDQRVSVDHNLEKGQYTLCFACGRPLDPADLQHPHYEEGVSCKHCYPEYNEAQRARFRMRQQQLTPTPATPR